MFFLKVMILFFESKLQCIKDENMTEWENNRNAILPFSKKLNAIKELMESDDFQRSKTIYDSVNPQAEQQNAEDAANLNISDEENDFPEEPEASTSAKRKKNKKKNDSPLVPEKCIFKKSIIPEKIDELSQSVRNLTYEQRVVFDKYIHYLQSIKCAKRGGGDIIPEPPRIIVHGKYIHIS